jgi:hypothetical protein
LGVKILVDVVRTRDPNVLVGLVTKEINLVTVLALDELRRLGGNQVAILHGCNKNATTLHIEYHNFTNTQAV